MKKDRSVLEEKLSFRILGFTFSSKLNWGSYIISVAQTTSKRIGTLIRSMTFLSPKLTPHLCKSTIHPSCYLEMLGKLQKRIFRTVGPSLAAPLESLTHCQNVGSLSLFCRCCFGRCLSELDELVPFPFSQGRSTRYSDRLHDFSVTRCYKDFYVNSFFLYTATLWNSVPIKCFHFIYNLNGFKSRINRYYLL